jgi:ubiquitin C-terminal hydrolase
MECLRHYTAVEELAEEILCEKCKCNRPTKKQLAMKSLPKVLVLQLKRFDALSERKVVSPHYSSFAMVS